MGLPPWHHVNRVLAPSGYAIEPPDLIVGLMGSVAAVPEKVPSLDTQANELIQRSLAQSGDLLNSCKRCSGSDLSSAMKSSRHSGRNVTCLRSSPSTKRPIVASHRNGLIQPR